MPTKAAEELIEVLGIQTRMWEVANDLISRVPVKLQGVEERLGARLASGVTDLMVAMAAILDGELSEQEIKTLIGLYRASLTGELLAKLVKITTMTHNKINQWAQDAIESVELELFDEKLNNY